ncbi:hypothetical protein [Intestinibacillus massiliensis]
MAYDGEVIIKIDGDGMLSGLQGALERLGSYLGDMGEQIHDGLATPMKDAAKAADDSMAKIMKSLSGGMSTLLQVVGAVEKAGKGFEAASAAVSAFTTAHTAAAGAEAAASASLTIYQAAVGVLTGQLGFAAAAQGVLNAAMEANPIGVVVTVIGALIAALALLGAACEEEVTETDKIIAKNEELQAQHEKWLDQQKRVADARNDAIALSNAENIKLEGYVESLKRCVDENGRVKEGYEDRAAYLTEQINHLIPGAIEANENEAGSYIKICDNIDTLIAKKKKEAMMNAYQEEYEEALKNVTTAQEKAIQLENEAAEAKKSVADAQNDLNVAKENYYKRAATNLNTDKEEEELGKAQRALRDAEDAYKSCAEQVGAARVEADKYVTTLDRVNALEISEKPEEIKSAMAELNAGMSSVAESGADNILQEFSRFEKVRDDAIAKLNDPALPEAQRQTQEQMAQDAQARIENLAKIYENGGNTLTSSMILAIDAGKDAVTEACYGVGREGAQDYAAGFASAQGDAESSAGQIKKVCEAALKGDTTEHGLNFMKGFVEAVLASNPSPEVRDMAQQALEALTVALDEAEDKTKKGANTLLATWHTSITEGKPAIDAAAKLVAAGILTEADIQDDMETIGKQLARGLASGIEAEKAEALMAATRLALDTVSAAMAAAKIQSPSRVMRDKVGKMLSAGMALGIADGEGGVRDAVRRVSDAAFAAARGGGGSYREIGARYMEDLSYGVKAGRDAAADEMARFVKANVEAYKKKADDETAVLVKAKKEQMDKVSKVQKDALQKETDQLQKDASDRKKAYEDAANGAAAAYKAKLAEGFDDALDITRQKVTAITDAFQKAHDAVSRQQESMQSKLAGYGDMFTAGKSGDLTLGNIEKNIEAIKRYDQALTALAEKGVSDEFMAKVTALGVDEGTKFAEKLVHMGTDGFSKYMDAWDEQQRLSQEVSSRFYAGQLEALDSGFQSKLGEALAGVPGTMANLGAQSLQSWADGLSAQMGDSAQDVKGLLDVLVATFGKAGNAPQAADGAQEDGAQTTDAYAGGIAARLGQVAKAAQGTVDAFSGAVAEALPQVGQAGGGVIDTLTGAVAERQGAVRSSAGQTAQSFCDTVNARYGQFRQTGLYAMQGLETGLREGGQSAISTAAWIADSIISEMQRALDIHSPSRKMARLVGKPAAEGVAVGFDREMAKVYRRIRGTLDGELSRISAAVQPQADREAARLSPQPIQTVYRSEIVEKQPVVEFRGSLAALGRVLEPHIRVESRRRGGNLVKGEIR